MLSSESSIKQEKNTQFKIKNSETSVLALNYIILNNKNASKIIVASCCDRPVSLIQFSEKQGLRQFGSFTPMFPISCTFYDRDKNLLHCGDIAGGLCTYSIEQKKFLKDELCYINQSFDVKERQALIMIHKRNHRFYLVNLRNQFKVVRANQMKLEYVIKFKYDLTTAIMFEQKQSLQLVLSTSFNNEKPPFIFNFHSQIQFQKATQKLQQTYVAQQEKNDQIIITTYFEKQNQLVCADIKHFISIYAIERLDLLCFQAVICWKVHTLDEILYMQIKQQFVYFVQSEKFQIIDLERKKKLYTYSKGNDLRLRWGVLLQKKTNDSKQQVSFVIARGFNCLNPQRSKIGKPNFHLMSGSIKQ